MYFGILVVRSARNTVII